MSTSVRFPHRVEEELASYCAAAGVTKSQVLLEAVSQYLKQAQTPAIAALAPASPVFRAFEQAGLVGQGAVDAPASSQGADKHAVREQVRKRLASGMASAA
jgi:hypothetical protein